MKSRSTNAQTGRDIGSISQMKHGRVRVFHRERFPERDGFGLEGSAALVGMGINLKCIGTDLSKVRSR